MNKSTSGNKLHIARWLLIGLYLISTIVFGGQMDHSTGQLFLLGSILVLMHAPKRYGWKGTFIFIATAYIVSTILEDMSIRTGFPFGNYHYTLGGLHIDQVPVLVGPVYIAVGYMSWTIGSIILDHADKHLDKKFNLISLPAVSAFIMCQFDLVQDPLTSTFDGIWIWENAGGIFGVPLVNFLGWYLTCYLFMQIFAIYLSKNSQIIIESGDTEKKSYWLQPVIFYLLIGLSYIGHYLHQINSDEVITDLAGNVWGVANLHETAVGIMLFTMLYSVVLATVRLFKPKN